MTTAQKQKQATDSGSATTETIAVPHTTTKIKVWISSMRGRTAQVELDEGTTATQFLTMESLEGSEFRVNDKAVPGTYKLQEGDVLVTMPSSIQGGTFRY